MPFPTVNVTGLFTLLFQILVPLTPVKFPTPILFPLRSKLPPFIVNVPLLEPSAALLPALSKPAETVVPPV